VMACTSSNFFFAQYRQVVEEIGKLQIEISDSENEWLNLEEEKHNLEKLLNEIKNK
jgi:cell division protein FtsL